MAAYKHLCDYASALDFNVPVRYKSESTFHDNPGDGIILYNSRFDCCPSLSKLIYAIEKKLSRANAIHKAATMVPLCIVLLCSDLYTIHSGVFHNTEDMLIESCWECLEFISISVDSCLQKWMENCISGRKCIEYSSLYCKDIRIHDNTIRTIPSHVIPKKIAFEPVCMSDIDANAFVWHQDDAVMETLLVHIQLASRCWHVNDSK